MRSLPAGWPAASNASVTDEVLVSLPDATWLSGPQVVDSFSVKRELVGSILPGQVRAGSGLSVADGDCMFYYRATEAAPWRQGSAKVTPTGTASLYAQAGAATIPLGVFDIDGAAAKLSTPTMGLDLIDKRISQRSPNTFRGYLSADGSRPVESAWVVDMLARSLGYYSTPAPVASCVLSVPFAGSIDSELPVQTPVVFGYPTGWSTEYGTISPVSAGFIPQYTLAAAAPVTSTFVTATTNGAIVIRFYVASSVYDAFELDLRPGGLFAVRNNEASAWVEGPYVAGDDPNHPKRVEVEIQRLGVPGAWTGVRARARSSATSAWSAWVTETTASTGSGNVCRVVSTNFYLTMIGLQITTASDPLVWAAPTASIYPLGSTLTAGYLPSALDAWGGIQSIAAANLGAAWVDAAGKLIVRDYSWTRGARGIDAALEVDDDLDDLGWATSREDYADRVSVTYRPPDVETRGPTTDPTVWTASEAYRIPALSGITISFDTENVAKDLWAWMPEWDLSTDPNVTRLSRWNARPFRDGTGTQPVSTALLFDVWQVNASRYVIRITNTTTGPLFTVNAAGEPALSLRANTMASFETEVVISSGLADDDARAALAVDCGPYVQTDTDARRVLNFVTSQTLSPKATVSQVLVPFDWRRELGDLYDLTHNGTLLDSKVMCVAIDLQGSPGDYRQLLDLVMLDTTLYDVDAAWDAANPSATLASRDAVWAGKTLGDIDLNPTKTA